MQIFDTVFFNWLSLPSNPNFRDYLVLESIVVRPEQLKGTLSVVSASHGLECVSFIRSCRCVVIQLDPIAFAFESMALKMASIVAMVPSFETSI